MHTYIYTYTCVYAPAESLGPRGGRFRLAVCICPKILMEAADGYHEIQCHVMCAYRLVQLGSSTPRHWAHLLRSSFRPRLLNETQQRRLASKITVSRNTAHHTRRAGMSALFFQTISFPCDRRPGTDSGPLIITGFTLLKAFGHVATQSQKRRRL